MLNWRLGVRQEHFMQVFEVLYDACILVRCACGMGYSVFTPL